MKKTLLITILVAVMLIAAIGSVNAASVTPGKATIKAGDTVTVTVKGDKATTGMQFDIDFPTDKFEFVSAKAEGMGEPTVANSVKETGKGMIMVYDAKNTTDTVVVTLKALKDLDNTEATVSASNMVYADDSTTETVGSTTIKIEKVEESKDPVEPTEPTDPEEPSNPSNPEKPSKDPVDVNGKPITKNPPTGTPLYIGAIAVIVVAAGAIFAVKRSK